VTFESWLIFCITETVLCFTPGPAVLLVVSVALTRGAAGGLHASIGILTANAFYFALSATGIGAILLASWELFFLIKWIGAGYLIWLGWRMLWSGVETSAPLANFADRRPDTPPAKGAFVSGLITQGANPKALFFFAALLPQFIQPEAPVAFQVAILGISSMLIELVVLGLYVFVCQRARRLMQRPAFAAALQRGGGALLIGAGAGLAGLRRP
jgi:homoserine/homoserine lactone efflux protein